MRRRKSGALIVLLACCCVVGAAGLSGAKAQRNGRSMGPMATEQAKRGEMQFQQNCGACHGPAAKGTTRAPNLIESTVVRHDKDGDQIGQIVRQGRLEKGMPSFPNLTTEQVDDVVAYLHARVIVSDSTAAATGPPGGYELKKLLTGDVSAGVRFFHAEGGCSGCHSAAGDLKGIAKRYTPAVLEARFLYPREDLRTVAVTLPSGQMVKGKLLHLDSFYVAVLDERGEYRSFSLSAVKVQTQDPLSGHLALLARYTDKDIHDVFAYLEML